MMEENNELEIKEDPVNFQYTASRWFLSPIERVWLAWTEQNFMESWLSPKPFQILTKAHAFENEGLWHYQTDWPDATMKWYRMDYVKIEEPFFYSGNNVRSDEEGNIIEENPVALWEVYFSGKDNGTRVKVLITFASQEELNKFSATDFEKSFSSAHDILDAILKTAAENEEE
jgi:hypothetical protein